MTHKEMEKEFLRKYTKVTLPGHKMMSKVIDIEDAIEIAEKYKQSATAVVIPKIAEDKAKKMKECKHLNKVYEQGWLVDDFYCKDCGKIF